MSSPAIPPLPWVCLVTDHTACRGGLVGLERTVLAALDSGVNLIQLREKAMSARELYELGTRLRRLTREAGALLVINDRLDVAQAVGADAVQLGHGSLPVAAVRQLVGQAMLIGKSVHGVAEAGEAQQAGADFLVVGTIFSSATHPEQSPAGPHLVKKIKARVKLPALAIGGITADNAAQAISNGADGVAVIRAILADGRPERAARQLVEAVRAAWPSAVLHRGI